MMSFFAGAAITVVVVVCVSFFIFLVFLAVVKIRSIHRRTLAGPETDLRTVNNRKKRSKMTLKSLKKLRKSIGRKRVRCEDDLDDDEYGDDVEQGHAAKPKPDMKWDDEGMSITVNPLEVGYYEKPGKPLADLCLAPFAFSHKLRIRTTSSFVRTCFLDRKGAADIIG